MLLQLGDQSLDLSRRAGVMGIVNVTPDSFYDGGATAARDDAVAAALAHAEAGAALVDVGGVKAGPGRHVDAATERERVLPVVQQLRERSDVPISVDTYRAEVAAAALDAGAGMVNDVTGLSDPDMLAVVAERPQAALVLMHHGGQIRGRPFRPDYHPDVTGAVVARLQQLITKATEAGVAPTQLVVDPGHDFGKSTWHSLEVTRRLPELVALGHPVLVALSRKDFLGEALGSDVTPQQRLEGSLAAAAIAVDRGVHLLRVHDSAATVAAVRTVEAILDRRPPATALRGLV